MESPEPKHTMDAKEEDEEEDEDEDEDDEYAIDDIGFESHIMDFQFHPDEKKRLLSACTIDGIVKVYRHGMNSCHTCTHVYVIVCAYALLDRVYS